MLFNWELPIGDSVNPIPRSSGPRIMGDRSRAQVIKDRVPGFAALANNHILDAGEEGLVDTLTSLRQIRFLTFGTGISQGEIEKPIIWEGSEGRLGIMNWVFPEIHPVWMAIPGPNCWPGLKKQSKVSKN
jgi:hypothetical protein